MNTFKKMYVAPGTEVLGTKTEEFMIEIGSGNTSPEESDSHTNFFEEEDDFSLGKQRSLWDD